MSASTLESVSRSIPAAGASRTTLRLWKGATSGPNSVVSIKKQSSSSMSTIQCQG